MLRDDMTMQDAWALVEALAPGAYAARTSTGGWAIVAPRDAFTHGALCGRLAHGRTQALAWRAAVREAVRQVFWCPVRGAAWVGYALACCAAVRQPASPDRWAALGEPEGPAPQGWAQVDT